MTTTTIGELAGLWRYPVKSMQGEALASASQGRDGVAGDRGWALRDEKAGEIRGAKKMPLLMRCSASYSSASEESGIGPVRMILPDGSSLDSDAPDVNGVLSRLLGREVTLWPRQPADNTTHYRRGAPDNEDFEEEIRQMFSRLPGEALPDLSVFPEELMEHTSPPGTYFDAFPLHLLTTASLEHMAGLNPAAAWEPARFRPNLLIRTVDDQQGLVEAGWQGARLKIGEVELDSLLPTVRCGMTTRATAGLADDPSVLRSIVADAGQDLGSYAGVSRAGEIKLGDTVALVTD
ncbi:MAG: MOSC N-terminal beta barrel domain-containing protein [Proteobacteria bacterium]|nr:MOSC N-terminal beta barrel domain-containing protein [Pseudomonadota bacterium]